MLVFPGDGTVFEAIGRGKAIKHTEEDGMTMAEFEQACRDVELDTRLSSTRGDQAALARGLGQYVVELDPSSVTLKQAS